MPKDYEYFCNGCGTPTKRSMLTVKKVLFTGMGSGANTTRARVVSWLCPTCTVRDADWQRPERMKPSERVTEVNRLG